MRPGPSRPRAKTSVRRMDRNWWLSHRPTRAASSAAIPRTRIAMPRRISSRKEPPTDRRYQPVEPGHKPGDEAGRWPRERHCESPRSRGEKSMPVSAVTIFVGWHHLNWTMAQPPPGAFGMLQCLREGRALGHLPGPLAPANPSEVFTDPLLAGLVSTGRAPVAGPDRGQAGLPLVTLRAFPPQWGTAALVG